MSGRSERRAAALERMENEEHIKSLRGMLSYSWAMFYIMVGGRGRGKTFIVQDYLAGSKIPFTWFRISPTSTQRLLANDARDFIDPVVVDRYGLDLSTEGNYVLNHGEPFARVDSLAQMAKTKGVALFNAESDEPVRIVLDEFNLETGKGGEKRTQDVVYTFINSLETLLRTRTRDVKIFLMANTLEEASDILMAFNFLPEGYGIYKLKSRRAVIWNIKNSREYERKHAKSAAGLMGGSRFSTFSNALNVDFTRVWKGALKKPTQRIIFSKECSFTVWDDRVIAEWKGETVGEHGLFPMKPHLGFAFSKEMRSAVTENFDKNQYLYRSLMVQKKFSHELERVRTTR